MILVFIILCFIVFILCLPLLKKSKIPSHKIQNNIIIKQNNKNKDEDDSDTLDYYSCNDIYFTTIIHKNQN